MTELPNNHSHSDADARLGRGVTLETAVVAGQAGVIDLSVVAVTQIEAAAIEPEAGPGHYVFSKDGVSVDSRVFSPSVLAPYPSYQKKIAAGYYWAIETEPAPDYFKTVTGKQYRRVADVFVIDWILTPIPMEDAVVLIRQRVSAWHDRQLSLGFSYLRRTWSLDPAAMFLVLSAKNMTDFNARHTQSMTDANAASLVLNRAQIRAMAQAMGTRLAEISTLAAGLHDRIGACQSVDQIAAIAAELT